MYRPAVGFTRLQLSMLLLLCSNAAAVACELKENQKLSVSAVACVNRFAVTFLH